MKLLFKHLMHSIGKKPTQPLIITVTLALAVALCVFALTVSGSLTADAYMAQEAKYGSADFTVELGNSSDSRFLFASDVRDALGEQANAAGIYPLPMILDGTADTVSGVATELVSICDLFSIEFTKYGRVTDSTLTEIAFVSSDFAESRGLSVGDEITVETMGRQRSYRIEGVSKRMFMERYDVMVDIGSVMRAFADQSLLFAAIGEGFKPCSTVYVDLIDESADLGEALDRLKADPRFEEKRFTDVGELENAEEYTSYLETFIGVVVAFTMLLAGVVTFCCFFILANQRRQENFSLSCCGASPLILGFMQYAEVIVYFLIGAPLGILISIPTVQTISIFVGLSYAEVAVRPGIALVSALLILAVCIATVSLFLAFSKRASRTGERRRRAGVGRVFLLVGVMLTLLGVLFIVPSSLSFAVYCIQLAVMVIFLFLSVSPLLQRLSLLICRITRRWRGERAISFRYAAKNVSSLKMMHNISMLCALATVTAFTVGFLLISFVFKATAFPAILQADFAVMNATDRCYDKIKECDEAESVNKFYMAVTDGITVVSSQDERVFSPSLNVFESPTGNGAIIGEGVSRKYSLKTGDNMDIELNGVQYSFEVTGIVQTGFGIVVINCEDVGIPYNSILVDGGEGVSDSELISALSEATATELAPIQSAGSLFEKVTDMMMTYIRAAVVLVCVLCVFFVIGTLDALYECMRARGKDYDLYCLAGITKGNLALMRVAEILIPIAFGILLGILTAAISVPSVNRSLAGFGVVPFLDIKALGF